jgi:hypothetical protein
MSEHDEGFAATAVISALVGVAATAVFALTFMQSDVVSRRLLLTPQQLATKRLSSYQYAWNQALLQQVALYYRATAPTVRDRYPTELLTTTAEIQELIARIVSRKLANLRVARIGRAMKKRRLWIRKSISFGCMNQIQIQIQTPAPLRIHLPM